MCFLLYQRILRIALRIFVADNPEVSFVGTLPCLTLCISFWCEDGFQGIVVVLFKWHIQIVFNMDLDFTKMELFYPDVGDIGKTNNIEEVGDIFNI